MSLYSPFFDQEQPSCSVVGIIAEVDHSPSWELEAAGVFSCESGGYLVVEVSGCSCWPDRGGTTQTHCPTKADVDRVLKEQYGDLISKCQDAEWKVTNYLRESAVSE